MNNERLINVRDIVYILHKHRKLIFTLAIVSVIIGAGLTAINYYISGTEEVNQVTASFAVVAENSRGTYTSNNSDPSSQDIYLAEDMVDSVIYVCTSEAVLGQVVTNLGLFGVTADSISAALTITQYKQTQILELSLLWPYPNEGVNILTEITNVAPDILVKTLGLGSVTVVNPAKVKTVTNKVNVKYLAFAVVGAVGAGLLYSLAGLYIHPTLVDTKSVRRLFELETLTELPHDELVESSAGYLSALDAKASSGYYRDCIDRAIHILNYKLKGDDTCLFVTSSMAGEGKTAVVAHLGMSFAEMGKRVLLVDLDLQNPSLSGMFMCRTEYEHSLNAAVNDEIPAKDAIVTLAKNLDFMPSRLEKKRMMIDQRLGDIINAVKGDYDLVLIDTSPVGQVADTMQTSMIAHKAIYVIRYDAVWVDTIQENIDRLRRSGTDILGCVINAVDSSGKTAYNYKKSGGNYGGYYHSSRQMPKGEPDEQPDDEAHEYNRSSYNIPSEPLSDHSPQGDSDTYAQEPEQVRTRAYADYSGTYEPQKPEKKKFGFSGFGKKKSEPKTKPVKANTAKNKRSKH